MYDGIYHFHEGNICLLDNDLFHTILNRPILKGRPSEDELIETEFTKEQSAFYETFLWFGEFLKTGEKQIREEAAWATKARVTGISSTTERIREQLLRDGSPKALYRTKRERR